MENYRKKLQKRTVGYVCTAILSVIISIIHACVNISKSPIASFSDARIVGFSAGILTSLAVFSAVKIVQLRRVIKDEKLIKLQYHKEHDERQKAIRSKAGMPMVLIMSILMFLASIIGGYYNDLVFYTLFIAGFVQLFVGVIVKIYYMKTM